MAAEEGKLQTRVMEDKDGGRYGSGGSGILKQQRKICDRETMGWGQKNIFRIMEVVGYKEINRDSGQGGWKNYICGATRSGIFGGKRQQCPTWCNINN